MHGLNGDILVWNHVTQRRHELTSMGIRVNAETLRQQLEIIGQTDFLKYPYHQAILENEIPLSIGGGIGQSRTMMLLLRKAHLGEVTCHGVAENSERDLRAEEHSRTGIGAFSDAGAQQGDSGCGFSLTVCRSLDCRGSFTG